ncbi:MAG: hypothetical protein U0531_11590 [Dehalococcoidia bacterium]
MVVFCGGVGGSDIEEMVARARTSAGLDSLERALSTGGYARALFITDRPELVRDAPDGVEVRPSPAPFHFGRDLAALVSAEGIDRLLYFGGGAVPLLPAADFAAIAARLAGDPVIITNNYFSADLVAVAPATVMVGASLPATDNPLPRLLHERTGLPVESLARGIATQLDIDTPTTPAIIALHGGAGPRLGRLLCEADLPLEMFRRAARVFVDRERTALIAGRAGSHVWQFIERQTACRVRMYAEERGMQADGRESAGLVRSLPGMLLDALGFEAFFGRLAELCDAAFLDSRVLTAHARRLPGRRDRFLSDLGRWQDIADPYLRDLTAAAARAPIPILLGGHALVSGGLMALVQAAWDEHDRERAPGHQPTPDAD